MFRKGFGSPLKIIDHSVQTNVPDYQKMIEQQSETRNYDNNYVTPPGPTSRPSYTEFATPKLSVIKTKVRRTRQQQGTTRHCSYGDTIQQNAPAHHMYISHGKNIPRSSSSEFPQQSDASKDNTSHIPGHLGSASSLPHRDYVEIEQGGNQPSTTSTLRNFNHGHHHLLQQHANMNPLPGAAFSHEVLHYDNHAHIHHGYSEGQLTQGCVDEQDFGEPRRYHPMGASHPIGQHMTTRSSSLPNSPRHSNMLSVHQVPSDVFHPNLMTDKTTSISQGGTLPLHSTPIEEPGVREGAHYPPQSSHIYSQSSMTRGQSGIASMTSGQPNIASVSSSQMNVTSAPLNDLTQWQQQHQNQLLRQRFSMTKTSECSPLFGVDFPSISSSDDPHKWDALKRVADSIIKEKDMIIERQRMKMMQAEQQSKDYETKLHRALQTQADRDGDILNIKFQEMQYDNASLKAHLTEIASSKDQQIEELQRKLGETEYELQELRAASKNETGAKSSEIENLKAKLSQKEDTILHWKEKYNEIEDKFSESRNKVKSLEHYLEDLPTADEYLTKKKKVPTATLR